MLARPRQLLGGEEGRLVEMVDDVAGDVFLGAGELVEALLDVLGEAFQLGGFGGGLGHGGPFRRACRLSLPIWLDGACR